ncbi:hypothetical protein Taro_017455 [Colocasia esculenta]|uniref:AAA+ ATPase domain-containing protein n=1 Tax=Colocasia esculenta TaxID=4460 RepID=A0A843UTB1_COLES|nr:hypothetical protein [Colocasia esculenta]
MLSPPSEPPPLLEPLSMLSRNNCLHFHLCLYLLYDLHQHHCQCLHLLRNHHQLTQVHLEGKYVVDIDKSIDITKITPSSRVALRNDSYMLHLTLPGKVDPLVNLMKVEKVPDSTYDMIGGLDQQIKEIKEVIELPIKHPELFKSLGIAQPKGVLLYGPPGIGKTLLARAVAHHTDCTFIRVSGSELVQKYIREGSRMIGYSHKTLFSLVDYSFVVQKTGKEYLADMLYSVIVLYVYITFVLAVFPFSGRLFPSIRNYSCQLFILSKLNYLLLFCREHAPSIIFMDEIDSIGSARMESGSGNGDSEVQRTMLELLNQLDAFEASNKIKVLVATNRIDILDQALLRPGRIDRQIEFPNPNEEVNAHASILIERDIIAVHHTGIQLTLLNLLLNEKGRKQE